MGIFLKGRLSRTRIALVIRVQIGRFRIIRASPVEAIRLADFRIWQARTDRSRRAELHKSAFVVGARLGRFHTRICRFVRVVLVKVDLVKVVCSRVRIGRLGHSLAPQV
jgi:hypothetical protein